MSNAFRVQDMSKADMSNGYRTLSQHLNDLKKENFSLKLRIYFLEERIQQKYDESSEDVYRTNIELKVEVESLKQELHEKQQYLDKALTAAESLTNHNELELQRRGEERQQEIDHMQEVLQNKIQLLQEEAQLARCEADRMASLAGSHSHASLLSLDTPMEDIPEDEKPLAALPPPTTNKDRLIEELTKELCSKDALITELSGEKKCLTQRVGELEGQLDDLSSSLLQKDKDVEFYQEELGRERLRIEQEMQSLVEEQQSQLNQYECAAGQCVSELQKAQLQVQSLQAKIHESEANNTKLQEKLTEMECELRSIRQDAQNQERTIQDLTDSVSTKDNEAQELYQLIEGQNATLCKLREMAHRNQLTQSQAPPESGSEVEVLARLQGELVGVQSSLFSLGLELEASQRSLRQSQRQGDDLATFKDRLHSDLQGALQHREVTDKHNQDLRSVLQRVRSELQAKEAALKERDAERHAEAQERERSDAQLKRSLRDKERQLQEYSEMLESAESGKPRDALLEKLRERIKNRDKALERSIDEKFRCLEDKEAEVRRLQLALREKERDLDRLRSILSNNEETITSLDSLVRGKELQLEQAAEAYRNLQWLKQQSEEKERTALRERDAVVSQLQAALQTRSQEAQDVTAALLARVQAGPAEVVEELKARLALKEKLFQELLSDRSRHSAEHQAQVLDLLNTIGAKDQYLQDCSDRLAQVIDERTGQLQELRQQLSSKEHELSDARREKEQEREAGGETELLRSRLKEKEAFIKELVQGQEEEESMESSCREGAPEVQALQEELCLVLKKERDAQKELCAVRETLAQVQQQAKQSASEDTEHQCVLERIVSEYQQLNDALRAEKRLYQSLSHIHTRGDSSEKTQALHTELDSVQALRGQLEEVLARTRDMAVALERAAQRRPDDFGELSTEEDAEEDEEGDDEEGSSDEFTDSIEDDGVKVTARSLASVQSSGMTRGLMGFSGGRGTAAPSQEDAETRLDVRQLEEARGTLEGEELEEMRSQLERDGYSSLAQMRSVLLSLQQENQALRESRPGGPGGLGGLGAQEEEEEEEEEDNEEEIEEEEAEEDEEYCVEEEEEGAPPAAVGKRGPPCVKLREGQGKRQCTRPHSLDLGTLLSHRQPQHSDKEGEEAGGGGAEAAGGFWQHVEEGLREQAHGLRADLALSRQENRELQERLMVSEATVHAQAEQLNDYRDLLSETSVQQANKQVQVDLQDLGYETCGRSENEAEREDTSSPEFDDLEMCTSLSNPQDYEGGSGGGWYQEDQSHVEGSYDLEEEEEDEELEVEEQGEGAASLQNVVRDLRSQLSRCHKVIRGLQLRIRSLSATSDYASSLERTPRKVNWAFEAASPAPSGVEEDEGWMSDSLATRTEPKSNRELRELVSRVTSLETQLKLQGKGLGEEGKCATWPGKYNTLIQAQARELSHLRQRMREGRGVCHILTQHLGDTTKAFEELLRANDIDYYMGQSFREQLAQSTALAQRVGTKISGRDRAEVHDDKTGHELLALRLSKELQQKDKIIESLHTKLQQRPETPSSCHALSETTDQSDRTSMVSDECRTHEDLDLCSDLDAASEYAEPGHGSEQEVCPSTPPPPTPGLKSSTSCPNMLSSNPVGLTNQPLRARLSGPVSCSLPGPLGPDPWGPHVTWEPPPRALSVTALSQEVDSLHRQMSQQHRGFLAPRKAMSALSLGGHNQHDLSLYGQNSHHAFHPYQLGVVPECGLSMKSDSGLVTGGGALWDMESGAQPVRGYTGSTGQISVNSHGGIDLIEEHLREVRCLRQRLEESIRTNERLRQQLEERLAVTGRDGGAPTNIYIQGLDTVTQLSNEIRVLKEDNLALQSRLQANSDASEEVAQLREAVLAGRARLKQAELEAEQWKEELRRLQTHSQEQGQQIHSLRQERQAGQENSNRLQHEASLLQQQLCESRDLIHSLQSELHVYDRVCAGSKADKDSLDPHSELEGEAPDGSFANRNGRHAIGHVDDFSALQQQVLEGRSLVQRMETTLHGCLSQSLLEANQEQTSDLVLDYGCVKSLLSNTKTLRQILEEAVSLLKMFWRAALPSSDRPTHNLVKEQSMQEEIMSLRVRMSEQEEVLQGTIQRLRSTSRTKESMEHFIVNQLSRTRDVLKKARTNLEKNEQRLSSLSSSPSCAYADKAEDPRGVARERPTDWSLLKPGDTADVATATPKQRLAARKRGSQCLLETLTC